MPDDFVPQLGDYGAAPSQLVDLAEEVGPDSLRYIDFQRLPSSGRPPVVWEVQKQPRAYVFDGRAEPSCDLVTQWVRRVAFRGDAEWIGVLRPGRLDVYPAALDGSTAPTRLTELPEGKLRFPALLHVPAGRVADSVRAKLLELLRRSIDRAKQCGVASADALSLVGRAMFWRFLIDRELLEGLDIDRICPGARDWPDCIATKTNALRTFRWLSETFNGSLLPLEAAPRSLPAEVFGTVLGNIAYLADEYGQLPLRLPRNWGEVSFAHVPVGLLSEVYESFLHTEAPQKARAESVYYTPRRLADFIVAEALDAVGDQKRVRVLDPSVGAGVFLVSMFRALVAREWTRCGKRPSRRIVRRIMTQQLTGFDINDSGLRLAELALYLTAIELDPARKPRPLKLLRFEELRDCVLFKKSGGQGMGSLGPVEERFRSAFDLVIGNPPWTAMKNAPKRDWTRETREVIESRLGPARAQVFEFSDNNPDLPFVFRAMEWAKTGGTIALVTHARWLFSQSKKMRQLRRDLLDCVNVTGVLNGAELRDTKVWPNVRQPFCLLFAANETPRPRSAMLFVSPELDRMPDSDQDRLRIDWQDATEIEHQAIKQRPWLLKTRYRGTDFDVALLDDLFRRGVPLGEYLVKLGTRLRDGYQVGGTARPRRSSSHLIGMPDLKGTDPDFYIRGASLPPFTRSELLHPRDPACYRGPVLLIRESVRAAALDPRVSLSLDDVVYDERFHGASFADIQSGDHIARYLQLVTQSDVFRHALLMLDGKLGVERETVQLSTIKSVPVVPWDQLSSRRKEQCTKLSKRLVAPTNSLAGGLDLLPVLDRINSFVADVYHLNAVQRDTVRDTLATALPTAEAKRTAVRATQPEERERFADIVQIELRSVLEASGKTATVLLLDDLSSAGWYLLQVDIGVRRPTLGTRVDLGRFIEEASESGASLAVVRLAPGRVTVGVLDRYRYWTPTRARLLAASLLSDPECHE